MVWQNTNRIAIDLGGSGFRWVTVTGGQQSKLRRESVSSMDGLVRIIRSSFVDGKVDGIALSVPGFVNSETGEVSKCRHAPWLNGNLRATLRRYFPGATIYIVNDGEAHALSLLADSRTRLGAINVSIGSAVGFGMLDVHGRPVRSASGTSWDIGDFQINTRATNKSAWWAVGSEGLRELENLYDGNQEKAFEHLGYRIGILLSQLAVIFRPNTIGLSGGIITKAWGVMERTIREEYENPVELYPQLISSVFEEAAIAGLLKLFELNF